MGELSECKRLFAMLMGRIVGQTLIILKSVLVLMAEKGEDKSKLESKFKDL